MRSSGRLGISERREQLVERARDHGAATMGSVAPPGVDLPPRDHPGEGSAPEEDDDHRAGRVSEHGLEAWVLGWVDCAYVSEVSWRCSRPANDEVAHRHHRPDAATASVLLRARTAQRSLEVVTGAGPSSLAAASDDERKPDRCRRGCHGANGREGPGARRHRRHHAGRP